MGKHAKKSSEGLWKRIGAGILAAVFTLLLLPAAALPSAADAGSEEPGEAPMEAPAEAPAEEAVPPDESDSLSGDDLTEVQSGPAPEQAYAPAEEAVSAPVLATAETQMTISLRDGETPVAGAAVTVTYTDGEGTEVDMTVSEETGGQYVVRGPADGTTYRYTITKFGYEEISGTLDYSESDPDFELSFPAIPTVTVSGTVVSAEGGVIENAAVRLEGYDTYPARTNEEGKFYIDGVYNTGSYTCYVTAERYQGKTVKITDITGVIEIPLSPKAEGVLSFDDVTDGAVSVQYGAVGVQHSATCGDGRTVSYDSEDPSVATVDETGKITTVGVGSTTIRAYCEETEDALYVGAAYTLTVTKGTQAALSWGETDIPTIAWDETFTNAASGGSGDAEIEYASSDTAIATVDGNGTVTPVKPGSVTITASKSGGTLYKDADGIRYELTITKARQTLAFAPAELFHSQIDGE